MCIQGEHSTVNHKSSRLQIDTIRPLCKESDTRVDDVNFSNTFELFISDELIFNSPSVSLQKSITMSVVEPTDCFCLVFNTVCDREMFPFPSKKHTTRRQNAACPRGLNRKFRTRRTSKTGGLNRHATSSARRL